MMSLRAFARSAPRTLARASAKSIRQSPIASSRTFLLKAAQPVQRAAAFSTSVFRAAPAGETDGELSAKLASEIEFEQDVKDNEPLPASIKDFLENGPFEIKDVPGKEEVQLTRTFGNEKITVSFSIADLENYNDDMYDQDTALGDDVEGAEGAEQRTQSSSRQAAELADEMDDEAGAGGALGNEAPVAVRLNIVIEKPGKGALNVEAEAQDGTIVVENVYYFEDAALAHGQTADAEHATRDVYSGPPFGSLDEDLQVLVERYLEERGITQALATFVPDYMDMKEQKEYLAWLNKMKTFVEA